MPVYPPSDDQSIAGRNPYPTFDPTTTAAGKNLANELVYRRRLEAEQATGGALPGVGPGPGWDAFNGALEHNAQDAAAQGKSYGLSFGGGRSAPSASLAARTGVADGGADPATAYQLGRAELQRALEENQGITEQNRMRSMTDALATDPGVIAAHAKDAAAQAETDAETRDQLAEGEFERTRGLRDAQTSEDVSRASKLAPFSPQAVAAADNAAAREFAARQRSQDVAGTNATRGQIGAEGAYARSAGASMPADPTRNQAATDSLRERAGFAPAAPGPGAAPSAPAAPGGKVFPAASLGQFAQEQGLTPQQAQDYITSHGYTIR
jgi:hypothetical protein